MAHSERIGVDRNNPDFIKARRLRFCKLLREGKRILKFSDEERAAVIALCKMIEKNSKT